MKTFIPKGWCSAAKIASMTSNVAMPMTMLWNCWHCCDTVPIGMLLYRQQCCWWEAMIPIAKLWIETADNAPIIPVTNVVKTALMLWHCHPSHMMQPLAILVLVWHECIYSRDCEGNMISFSSFGGAACFRNASQGDRHHLSDLDLSGWAAASGPKKTPSTMVQTLAFMFNFLCCDVLVVCFHILFFSDFSVFWFRLSPFPHSFSSSFSSFLSSTSSLSSLAIAHALPMHIQPGHDKAQLRRSFPAETEQLSCPPCSVSPRMSCETSRWHCPCLPASIILDTEGKLLEPQLRRSAFAPSEDFRQCSSQAACGVVVRKLSSKCSSSWGNWVGDMTLCLEHCAFATRPGCQLKQTNAVKISFSCSGTILLEDRSWGHSQAASTWDPLTTC